MTLMRFDPFRELDRLAERVTGSSGRTMAMEAVRRGDEFLVQLDLPGVREEDVDITVERNVLTIHARREPVREEGDEVVVDERAYGEFSRQLYLGENLDTDRLEAQLRDGVLSLRIPVSESSKPRRVRIGGRTEEESPGDAQSQQATPGDAPDSGTGQSSQQPANV